jgi:hypothetical protein
VLCDEATSLFLPVSGHRATNRKRFVMTATSGSGRLPPEIIHLRVLHDGAKPIHDTGEPYRFGLERKTGDVQAGTPAAKGGLQFDIVLRVKDGADAERPDFFGEFVKGPPGARCLHLGWKPDRPGWINRVKVPLSGITWDQVRAAQASNRRLIADASGRRPHEPRPLSWGTEP